MNDSPRLKDEGSDNQEYKNPHRTRSYRPKRYDYNDYNNSGRDVNDTTIDDPALNKKRWKNRRRMAWISLASMTIITYLLVFTKIVPEGRLHILSDVITWYYFSCSSIIGMYMGATTWASIRSR